MVAYNFLAKFVPAIKTGRKSHTFRVYGKRRHVRPGRLVQLYTGMRTKACRRIAETTCTHVDRMTVGDDYIMLNGQILGHIRLKKLTQADGFDTPADFFAWVKATHGFPAEGVLVHWDPEDVIRQADTDT